jgi:hypothetical protein
MNQIFNQDFSFIILSFLNHEELTYIKNIFFKKNKKLFYKYLEIATRNDIVDLCSNFSPILTDDFINKTYNAFYDFNNENESKYFERENIKNKLLTITITRSQLDLFNFITLHYENTVSECKYFDYNVYEAILLSDNVELLETLLNTDECTYDILDDNYDKVKHILLQKDIPNIVKKLQINSGTKSNILYSFQEIIRIRTLDDKLQIINKLSEKYGIDNVLYDKTDIY